MMNGVPDNFRFDREVDVYQPISHGSHEMPWDFWMRSLHVIGNVTGRLADDDEVKLDRFDGFGISLRGL